MGLLLDQIVLRGTRHSLLRTDAERVWMTFKNKPVELIRLHAISSGGERTGLQVIKFVGAAGRAENASMHPLDHWNQWPGSVTVANPPGYGNSPGRANMSQLVDLAESTYRFVCEQAKADPIILYGTSLGGAVAICLAARLLKQHGLPPAAGIIVRDAPQLDQVIWRRFRWKTGILPAWCLCHGVPKSLNVAEAAAFCSTPAVIVSSMRDRVVPYDAQRYWIDRYAGPKQLVELPETGHYDPIGPDEISGYLTALDWLQRAASNSTPQTAGS